MKGMIMPSVLLVAMMSVNVCVIGFIGAVGYGLADILELYVQMSLADIQAKVKAGEPGDIWRDINPDDDFAWR